MADTDTMTTTTQIHFTISVGDRFECTDTANRIQQYRVLTIAANGSVMAENVETGKQRQFPGYGRMLQIHGRPCGH